MALTSAGKAVVLAGLCSEALSLVITNSSDVIVDTKVVSNGDFSFTTSASGMVLAANVVFEIPAGTVVTAVKIYDNPVPASGNILDSALLPGLAAARTYTYDGNYTLTGYTITAA